MRQGLTEWAVVTAVLALVATLGALRHGHEVRAAFGVDRPVARGAAPAYPSAPWLPR